MTVRTIKVPDIGEGIAEVEVTAWHVKPGDRVSEDQPLADVMTDKANVEIPSPVAGTVVSLGGEVGQVLPVGGELIRIELGGGEADSRADSRADSAADSGARSMGSARGAAIEPAIKLPVEPAGEPPIEPAIEPASKAPVRPTALARGASAPAAASASGERPIASPAVRRRAWEAGVDLREVLPSGLGRRIMHADLDAYLAAHPAPREPAKPAVSRTQGAEVIPITGVRRKIAQKMQEAKRRIPHFTYVEEVDVTELETLRARMNERWQSARGHLTVLPFVMRAVVMAVHEHPEINARFDDETGVVTRHAAVHLGVATQTDSGLMVPVVRHAETLDLWQSGAEVARLAQAARAGRATREELSGSTITVTSLGALGGIVSTPVINHPEVAIVGVNRIVERPTMRGGAVVPRLLMNLSSSFDHRVVDGHQAAQFVQDVRALLENPAMLFIE